MCHLFNKPCDAQCLNKRLSKQSRRRWFEKLLRSLWRHCYDNPAWHNVLRDLLIHQHEFNRRNSTGKHWWPKENATKNAHSELLIWIFLHMPRNVINVSPCLYHWYHSFLNNLLFCMMEWCEQVTSCVNVIDFNGCQAKPGGLQNQT